LGEVEQVWAEYALRAHYDEPGFRQEDVYTIHLRFASGVPATFNVCCILHRRYRVGLEVLCKNRAYRLHERALEIDDADGTRSIPLENEPGFDENAAFIRAVKTGDCSGILSDYADALSTHRLVLTANEATRAGERRGVTEHARPVRLYHG
jgi:predicted dehydrogenase